MKRKIQYVWIKKNPFTYRNGFRKIVQRTWRHAFNLKTQKAPVKKTRLYYLARLLKSTNSFTFHCRSRHQNSLFQNTDVKRSISCLVYYSQFNVVCMMYLNPGYLTSILRLIYKKKQESYKETYNLSVNFCSFRKDRNRSCTSHAFKIWE